MAAIRHLNAADQAEIAADHHSLPKGRITERRGVAYVFLAFFTDLEAWAHVLGIRPICQPVGDGTVRWVLNARFHGTPVRVHASALDTDLIDDDLTVA